MDYLEIAKQAAGHALTAGVMAIIAYFSTTNPTYQLAIWWGLIAAGKAFFADLEKQSTGRKAPAPAGIGINGHAATVKAYFF